MIARFFWYLFKLNGYKIVKNVPPEAHRAVVIGAPHTSNWDGIYTFGCFWKMGIPLRFTVKDELNKFPFKSFLDNVGAIWINRRPKVAGDARPKMVDIMTDLFKQNKELALLVTPEGTRSKRTEWKSGFYHVAKNAGVPIILSYIDYKKKEAGIWNVFYPTDNKEEDMKKIMAFYQTIEGKHPEKFSVDLRYLPDNTNLN